LLTRHANLVENAKLVKNGTFIQKKEHFSLAPKKEEKKQPKKKAASKPKKNPSTAEHQ
jgi:hypothetical protein